MSFTLNLLTNNRFSNALDGWAAAGNADIVAVDELWQYGAYALRLGSNGVIEQEVEEDIT